MNSTKLLEKLKKTKPIESEKEYWEAHKIFKKATSKMTLDFKKLAGNPKEYINNFEELLDEAIRIKIINEEFKEQQMKRLMKELNSPNEFKFWLKDKLDKAKSKFKK